MCGQYHGWLLLLLLCGCDDFRRSNNAIQARCCCCPDRGINGSSNSSNIGISAADTANGSNAAHVYQCAAGCWTAAYQQLIAAIYKENTSHTKNAHLIIYNGCPVAQKLPLLLPLIYTVCLPLIAGDPPLSLILSQPMCKGLHSLPHSLSLRAALRSRLRSGSPSSLRTSLKILRT